MFYARCRRSLLRKPCRRFSFSRSVWVRSYETSLRMFLADDDGSGNRKDARFVVKGRWERSASVVSDNTGSGGRRASLDNLDNYLRASRWRRRLGRAGAGRSFDNVIVPRPPRGATRNRWTGDGWAVRFRVRQLVPRGINYRRAPLPRYTATLGPTRVRERHFRRNCDPPTHPIPPDRKTRRPFSGAMRHSAFRATVTVTVGFHGTARLRVRASNCRGWFARLAVIRSGVLFAPYFFYSRVVATQRCTGFLFGQRWTPAIVSKHCSENRKRYFYGSRIMLPFEKRKKKNPRDTFSLSSAPFSYGYLMRLSMVNTRGTPDRVEPSLGIRFKDY